ncbi:MAG TPA: peptidoglycan DD-metalloendopeptidase family protein [Actinomycetota bacterium]|nr:peptidoglycan DD-metalloendopeptidase family protein [Actinomycetota bacterium]
MRGVRSTAFARVVASLAASLLLASAAGTTATADTKKELAAAKAKLKALEKRMEASERRLKELRAAGDAIAGQMHLAYESIEVLQAKERRVRQEIHGVRERLLGIQGRLDDRARTAYQTGGVFSLELLLSSSSLSDLSSRLEIVDRATDSDRALIERVEGLDAQLRTRQAELQRLEIQRLGQNRHLLERQQTLQRQLNTEVDLINQQKSDAKKISALAKKLGEDWQQQVEEARQRAIQSTTRKALLKPAPKKPSGPALSKNTVLQICPVDPPRHYTSSFGDPRSGGRSHQGNDIMAPYGTPVRAPFPGVATTSSSYLGGLGVYVHGERGFVFNAHLSRFGKLGRVKAGDIIGYVGNTGNARYTSPHNHFEWHPGGGSAVDPYPYLNEVC